MKALLHNIRVILVIFTLIFVALLTGLVIQENRSRHELLAVAGENKRALASRYAKAGRIESIDGVALAYSQDGSRHYAEDGDLAASVMQVVGDYTHNITNTIESRYQGLLLGNDRPFFQQFKLDLQGKGLGGDDVVLTLRSDLNRKAYQLMKDKKGAVVMLNYQTGDILASVSTPTTSPQQVVRYEDIPDGALFNRAILGRYAPGSTFKYITSAAWLSSRAYDPNLVVNCLGNVPLIQPDGVKEGDGHGHQAVNLDQALQVSCNYFFGDVALKMGREQLVQTIRQFGIGQPIHLDRLSGVSAQVNVPDRESTLTWMSIGQPVADSQLGISPLEMAMLIGGIANGGQVVEPHIVDHVIAPSGEAYLKRQVKPLRQIVSQDMAQRLQDLLKSVVRDGSAHPAAIQGYEIAGKTGTAEVDGQKNNNALFVGFVADEAHPYCIAVVCEDVGFGAAFAAPIAHDLFALAIQAS